MKIIALLLVLGLSSCSGLKWKTTNVSTKHIFGITVPTKNSRKISSIKERALGRTHRIAFPTKLKQGRQGSERECQPIFGATLERLTAHSGPFGSDSVDRYAAYYRY